MQDLLWLIPALPLAGFLILVLSGGRIREPLAGWLATAMVGASFAVTVAVFADLVSHGEEERTFTQTLFEWLPSGSFQVGFGFLADPLSITMCLFVTGVGALIHLYAIGYMHGDPKFTKFFLYLNLFVFSMLMLVLGDNLLITFLGWEGVGACSYFLIAFWHTDISNATAGKKAFVTNRVGDWGFMVGTFLVWTTIGSVNYLDISAGASGVAAVTATAIVVLFFVAATGKSAQIPLFVWLPDAMAGPTPVSALIHAATMVTSGVYLLVRLNPLLFEAGWANDVIAWVGAITALVAALIAISQNDIKKVLAFSTVSQLGYLFLAVGTGNYVAAIFHMVTHAFFKALLFLGAGSVIHGMAHDQDMRHYGNLRKYMPITAGTFIVGWLAIAGVPPFSGFWSKDEILAGAWDYSSGGKVLWAIGLLTALITAFYMTRQVVMTFFGEEKWRSLTGEGHDPAGGSAVNAAENADADLEHSPAHDQHGLTPDFEPHESPPLMTLPLVALAGLAIVGGLINLPFSDQFERLGGWLEPVIAHEHEMPGGSTLVVLAIVAILAALTGIGLALVVYVRKRIPAKDIEQEAFARGFYIDESYSRFVGGPGRRLFDAVAWFDANVIDGAVNGVGTVTQVAGTQLRRLQSGRVRGYAMGMAIGAVLLVGYAVARMGF
ncbi:MAG TPA: NADH-quinone oxidoreductase subunit L [Microthrixaceae bacterium]|nr:NADH-quinone oxidoreductase subunit L [Microthrixaceae bacterium]